MVDTKSEGVSTMSVKLRFRQTGDLLIIIFPDGSAMERRLEPGEDPEDIMQKLRSTFNEGGFGILDEDNGSMTLGRIQ